MPLYLDDLRKEFARFLAEDPSGRFRMDQALVRVVEMAYAAGLAESTEETLPVLGIRGEPKCPNCDIAWRNVAILDRERIRLERELRHDRDE